MNEELKSVRGPEMPVEYIEEDDGIDLRRLIATISEARWLVLGIAAAVFLLGCLYTIVKTPVYEAYTDLIVLDNKSGGLSGLEQLSAAVQGSALPTATEIQLLQTRAVIEPVVEKLHLDIQIGTGFFSRLGHFIGLSEKPAIDVASFKVPPELEGQPFTVKPTGDNTYSLFDPDGDKILDGTLAHEDSARIETADGYGVVSLRIDSFGGKMGNFTITHTSTDQAVDALLSKLSVDELGLQTGIVRAKLDGTSPRLITRELNEIANQNVKQNARRSAVQAANQLQFLKTQLPDVEQELQKSQKKLSDFLSNHQTLVFSQDATYLANQAATIEQQTAPLEAQIAAAKSSLGAHNPALTAMQSQLNALNKQHDDLLNSLSKLPKDQQTLIRLQSDATTSQSLYQAMLNQMQTLQIAQAGAIGDVVVVDPATVPVDPVRPNKPLVLGLMLVLGLFLGAGAAFARRALNNGIEDPDVLDTVLGLPVYAVIAHSKNQERMERDPSLLSGDTAPLLAAQEKVSDATIEGLKSLRTALQLAMPKSGPNVLCLSSLGPSEGKSFIASNLSYLFVQSGLKVLLLDADMRRGHLHKVFGLPRGPGLSELLAGNITQEQAIKPTGIDGLDIISTGALPPDAANLLLNADISTLVDHVNKLYDVVIVDVPPVLAVSDAYMITRHATINLLLLKYGLHSERQVQMVQRQFARHGIELLGSIFNDVTSASQRYAYYQYGYKYQYHYKPSAPS